MLIAFIPKGLLKLKVLREKNPSDFSAELQSLHNVLYYKTKWFSDVVFIELIPVGLRVTAFRWVLRVPR